MFVPEGPLRKPAPDEPLITNVLYERIQNFIDAKSLVVAETGDSWFNCLKLRLPEGCGYEFQMQYGSIGWSVGATLGAAAAAAGSAAPEALEAAAAGAGATAAEGLKRRRVIASIGDGSFQMTAQDVSTMMRYRLNPIIILVNNAVSLKRGKESFFVLFLFVENEFFFFFSFHFRRRRPRFSLSFSFFLRLRLFFSLSSFFLSSTTSGIHNRGRDPRR